MSAAPPRPPRLGCLDDRDADGTGDARSLDPVERDRGPGTATTELMSRAEVLVVEPKPLALFRPDEAMALVGVEPEHLPVHRRSFPDLATPLGQATPPCRSV